MSEIKKGGSTKPVLSKGEGLITGGIKRRDFLKILGVVGGTAAITGGCSPEPVEKIIPYVITPDTGNSSGRLEPTAWDEAESILVEKIKEIRSKGNGNKIVFLTNNISGSLNRLIDDWVNALGGRHIVYETFSHEPLKEANRISFGINKIPTYHI